MTTTVKLNQEGEAMGYAPDLSGVPAPDRAGVRNLIVEFACGVDSTLVPLPGGEVTFGKPWTARR
ncbi:MAG TPA: hypothetical protein VH092_32335, partial [Urbifossiella sp.]|nr:hypothetical protein [Urbifossiella sp.]